MSKVKAVAVYVGKLALKGLCLGAKGVLLGLALLAAKASALCGRAASWVASKAA